jgi:hypothetical protein
MQRPDVRFYRCDSGHVIEELYFQDSHPQEFEQFFGAATAHQVAESFHVRNDSNLFVENQALGKKS